MIKSYLLKKGEKRYQFQIYVGVDPLTGKELRTTRRGFKTKKEAELELARLKLDIDKGAFRKQQAQTYQDIYDLWILQYENTVQESTFVKTVRIFKNQILPHFGQYKIEKINAALCQNAVNEWFNKYAEYRTFKTYTSKLFDYAIKHGYIQLNPMKLVEMPRKKEAPGEDDDRTMEKFYTKEELNKFLEVARENNSLKVYTAFRLLSYTGMRKGELLALTWNDINFKEAEIRINKALSRGKNKLYVKTTKNGTSRTIKIDDVTLSILDEWRKKQKQDYLILGYNTLKPNQLVLSNNSNGYLQPITINEWMKNIIDKFKLKRVTVHALRHTHCSLLFEAGASIKEVQDRLGHTDVQTTMNIYAHVSEKAKEGAINKFTAYLNN